MSVATSVVAVPAWNASMLRVRAPWLRLPCSSTVGTPLRLSWRASALAPCLVRVKTTVRPGALVRSTSTGTRCSRATCSTWWSISVTGDCAESASWVTGWLKELLDQDVDAPVEGGREEQPLALLRGRGEEPAYGGQEAEVGHVVGLVEHGDLDGAEVAVTLLDEVLEPARAGHHDVDAAAQPLHLRVLADAAEDGAGGQAGGRGERAERLLDLADQLARGREDQGARACAHARPAGLESRATRGSRNA